MTNPENKKPKDQTSLSRRWFLGSAGTAAALATTGGIAPVMATVAKGVATSVSPEIAKALEKNLVAQIRDFDMSKLIQHLEGGLVGTSKNHEKVARMVEVLETPTKISMSDLDNYIHENISLFGETLGKLPQDSRLDDLVSDEFLAGLKIAYKDIDTDSVRQKLTQIFEQFKRFGIDKHSTVSEAIEKFNNIRLDIAENILKQLPDNESWHTQHISKSIIPSSNSPRVEELRDIAHKKQFGKTRKEMETYMEEERRQYMQKAEEEAREQQKRPTLTFTIHPQDWNENYPLGAKIFKIHGNNSSYDLNAKDIMSLFNVNNIVGFPKIIPNKNDNSLTIIVTDETQKQFFRRIISEGGGITKIKIPITKDKAKDYI
jgi:hypothetical protein